MLLLDIWRMVGRQAALAETVTHAAERLGQEMPLQALAVRRLELPRLRLETVATAAAPGEAPPPASARTQLTPAQLRELAAWGRAGRALRLSSGGVAAGGGHPLADAMPRGDVLALPLLEGQALVGVLVACAPAGTARPEHEELLAQLLEPFAAALASEEKLHELSRRREALEADKAALLSRLSREEIADAVVGSDSGLRDVMRRVVQVAPTDAPVLLIGETGTGKEVIAREIHRRSARADNPVVRVNCGAIPPGLVDSELFGHERGSFTGAVNTRAGWFERADGGTLFLDEIGELPLEAQVRLLRILQEGTFERVGGHKTLTVDVRIVAATNRDLPSLVREGRFREDLWYRIDVFSIRLPPLRERVQDIPPLAAHFARRAGRRLGGAPLVPSGEDIRLLLAYDWPGNVRELAAVMERAAILGNGRSLELRGALGNADGQGGPRLLQNPPTPAVPAMTAAPAGDGILPLDAAAARHIERALQATYGRIEGPFGAAALLGINPHTLRSRMRKLGIEWARFRRVAMR
ncbi:MAG TPA: sigma 54-interacting transcriptional regulator [Longimicrobiales bacterium]